MDTLEYVKQRRKLKCVHQTRKVPTDLHDRIGRLLLQEMGVRSKMEIQKPEVVLLPPQELDYIF